MLTYLTELAMQAKDWVIAATSEYLPMLAMSALGVFLFFLFFGDDETAGDN